MIKKEIVTKENMIKDCLAAEKSFLYDPLWYRCFALVNFGLWAVILFLGHFGWIAWLDMVIIAYHLVLLIRRIVYIVLRCKRIRNGEFSVSSDVLKYINTERIYEPHHAGRHMRLMREVTKLYFTSLSHRLAYTTYYPWSQEYYCTPQGLLYTALEGDEFYLVLDNQTHDVLYIYNKKFFELNE